MEPVAAGRRRAKPAGGVTPAELREVERGLKLMLARKFSAVWIAENTKDLLAQANVEYAEWLEANPPARNPIGWLLTCAYRRALNLLDTQSRRPRPASLDSVFHLADESTPTPEQQALDNDRQGRLRKALGHLPEKERQLLALIYFEGMSIREAGRKVGWQKSVSARHHRAAMEKMLALVGDRSLLSPASLGMAAWVVVKGERSRSWTAPAQAGVDLIREGVEAFRFGAHRLGELGRRLLPFSEPGPATAAGSAGRALGYCAAAAGTVVCGLAATGAVGPGLGAVETERPVPAKPRIAKPLRQTPSPDPPPSVTDAPTASRATPRPTTRAEPPRVSRKATKAEAGDTQGQLAPRASGSETVSEFGIERESGEGSGSAPGADSSGGETSSSPPPSAPSPAPRPPDSAASSEFGL